jgi:hypothetical protein
MVSDKTLEAIAKVKYYKENPIEFVRTHFQVEPDIWQKKALVAFVNKEHKILRMCLSACAGPGKSALLAWCGWIFLSCYGSRGNHPKGAVVAVTKDNLKDNLWAELSKWQQRSEYLKLQFTWTKERIFSNAFPETWFLSARSFAKTANAEEQGRTLSGIHSKYVLFLIDESGDIPTTVLKAAEQALSTADKEFARVIQAGNPTSLEGMLYVAQSKLADSWHIIRITGDPDDPDRSPRIDIDWARQQIKEYGLDDPWVMAYILGQFPESGINTLLSLKEVDDSMSRTVPADAIRHSQKRLGIDVARFGLDSTVIVPRHGLVMFKYATMRGARTNDIAARVMNAKVKWGSELEFVDGTGGYGGGVVDALIQAGQAPHEIQFSGKAVDPRYFNKRAEIWFKMADWVKRSGCLYNCPLLKKELLAPTYSFKNGRFVLESKDQIKARLGFSPDRGDALALTFAIPDMPASESPYEVLKVKQNKVKADWDPMSR